MLNAFRPLLLLAALSALVPAAAQDAAPPPPVEIRSQREDAGARVRQVERAGGRVLQAEPMQRGGQEVYRFKVLTPEGRVRVMQGEPQRNRPESSGTRETRPRSAGFDRSTELTGRRRDFRNDTGTDVARAREERERMRRAQDSQPAPRAAGEPASE
jgi:hypothetical protein